MAFGSSANQAKPKDATAKGESKDIFFDTKVGQRFFRIVPGCDEVRMRALFFAKEADGTWVPTFGYNESDRRTKKPVAIAVYNAETESWVYGGEWGKNPVDLYVASLDIPEDERNKLYAPEEFRITVLDRTPVKTMPDGTILYPDTRGKYPVGSENIVAQRINKIKILKGSSGIPKDKDGDWKGKHLYRKLLEMMDGQLDEIGTPISPTEYDICLLTSGKGKDTSRTPSRVHGTQEVIDWSQYKAFDLKSWIKPWSFEAISQFMAGGDYDELLKLQNISMYPEEIDIDLGEALF